MNHFMRHSAATCIILLMLTACADFGIKSDEQYLAASCATGNAAIKAVIVAHDSKKMSDEEYASLKGPVEKFRGICGADHPISRAELKQRGFDELVAYLAKVAGL